MTITVLRIVFCFVTTCLWIIRLLGNWKQSVLKDVFSMNMSRFYIPQSLCQ